MLHLSQQEVKKTGFDDILDTPKEQTLESLFTGERLNSTWFVCISDDPDSCL